jgi:hypothetical protein
MCVWREKIMNVASAASAASANTEIEKIMGVFQYSERINKITSQLDVAKDDGSLSVELITVISIITTPPLEIKDPEKFKLALVNKLEDFFSADLKDESGEWVDLAVAIETVRESYLPRELSARLSPQDFAKQVISTTNILSQFGPYGGLNTTEHGMFMNHQYRVSSGSYPDQELELRDSDARYSARMRDLIEPFFGLKETLKDKSNSNVRYAVETMVTKNKRNVSSFSDDLYADISNKINSGSPWYGTFAINGIKPENGQLKFGLHAVVISLYKVNHDTILVVNNHGDGILESDKVEFSRNGREVIRVKPRVIKLSDFSKEFVLNLVSVQTNMHLNYSDNVDAYMQVLSDYSAEDQSIPEKFKVLNHDFLTKSTMQNDSCVTKAYDSAYKCRLAIRLYEVLFMAEISHDTSVSVAAHLMRLLNRARKDHRDTELLPNLANVTIDDSWNKFVRSSLETKLVGKNNRRMTIDKQLDLSISNAYPKDRNRNTSDIPERRLLDRSLRNVIVETPYLRAVVESSPAYSRVKMLIEKYEFDSVSRDELVQAAETNETLRREAKWRTQLQRHCCNIS